MCLARKLNDAECTAHYAALAETYSEETLLLAYRRALKSNSASGDIARRFHTELKTIGGHSLAQAPVRLLAIKVERRSIAVAVFIGNRLDDSQVRHLSSNADRAESSAVGFITWAVENFGIESAALERMTNGREIRRTALHRAVLAALRDNSMPVWEVGKQQLFEVFGHPPLRSRTELRQIMEAIVWPVLEGGRSSNQKLDAAALGLYVQTERLFLN